MVIKSQQSRSRLIRPKMKITETLAVLEQWQADSQLFISLSPPFTVTLEVDHSAMRDALARSTLSPDDFKAASNEIGLILLNVLNGTEDRYVLGTGGGNDNESDPEAQAAQEQHRAHIEEVKSHLYDGCLQRRYDMKKSSKEPSFNGVDWDVKVKHFDAGLGDFQPFPYATLRLSFQRDFEDSAFAVLGGKTFDSVEISFSKDEVDHLIRVLSGTRERLVSLEKEQA